MGSTQASNKIGRSNSGLGREQESQKNYFPLWSNIWHGGYENKCWIRIALILVVFVMNKATFRSKKVTRQHGIWMSKCTRQQRIGTLAGSVNWKYGNNRGTKWEAVPDFSPPFHKYMLQNSRSQLFSNSLEIHARRFDQSTRQNWKIKFHAT